MPVLADRFGIRPWEMGLVTPGQYESIRNALEAEAAEARRAAGKR